MTGGWRPGGGLSRAPRRGIRSPIRYARASTAEGDRVLGRRLDALDAAGCERVVEDRASGAKAERPGLSRRLDHPRRGDALVMLDLDRPRRLAQTGVGFRAPNSAMDTATPRGRAFVQIQTAFAGMERDVIRQRARGGLAAARTRGRRGGRPRVTTPGRPRYARRLLADRCRSIPATRTELGGMPRSALCHHRHPDGRRSARGAGRRGTGLRRGGDADRGGRRADLGCERFTARLRRWHRWLTPTTSRRLARIAAGGRCSTNASSSR